MPVPNCGLGSQIDLSTSLLQFITLKSSVFVKYVIENSTVDVKNPFLEVPFWVQLKLIPCLFNRSLIQIGTFVQDFWRRLYVM